MVLRQWKRQIASWYSAILYLSIDIIINIYFLYRGNDSIIIIMYYIGDLELRIELKNKDESTASLSKKVRSLIHPPIHPIM